MRCYKSIIFDCDGVVFDSNSKKISALRDTLEQAGNTRQVVEVSIKEFAENFGRTRKQHFEIMHNKFGIQGDIEELTRAYSEKVDVLYDTAQYTPGFLERFSDDDRPKYLVSASDEKQLKRVFKARLDTEFLEILGGPVSKADNLSSLIRRGEIDLGSCCYIGDALNDLLAAESVSLDFIAYTPFANERKKLIEASLLKNYQVISSWKEFVW